MTAATPVFKPVPRVAAALQTALAEVQVVAQDPASRQAFRFLGKNDLATFGASAFVGLGWVAVLALPGVWTHAGAAAGVLMLVGGLLYTAGAVSYHRRRPDPYPAVFGYHEVFHACVCVAAACQYAAIALFLANRG